MGLETLAATAIGATVAGGVTSAASSYYGGKSQAKSYRQQGEANALVYEQQAEMIKHQQKLEGYQYDRRIGRTRGKGIARTAGAGLELGGSPLAKIADTEAQLLLDRSIGQYNLEVQKNFAETSAGFSRYEGEQKARLAKARGKANAFSTMLRTGASAAMMGYMAFGGGAGAGTSLTGKKEYIGSYAGYRKA